ncbi:matrixin [Aquimarina sp. MAR_2010_214]|uniref:M57 family metalloprotease n=1 Tax=Aquimarina sp. MAR_2010_214 TaxID=1250026 RepID=UPI000C70BBD7|nr:M57 family metalloprotease [Aquimarina sp. MAR_2010_214]PKV48753.1 matrixin [Aquimarina sp. MAR_2010_214]
MKNSKLLILWLTVIAISACESDTVEENQEVQQKEVSEETLGKLKNMGFNTEIIPVFKDGDGVIVEGDIYISNKELTNPNISKQKYFRLISCKNSKNIKIKNSLGDNVAGKAFDAAVKRWNSVNGSFLKLKVVKKDPDINIRLADKNELKPRNNSVTYGQGTFPKNGKAGDLIKLKLDAKHSSINNGKKLTQKQWVNVITHEIGHNIGFAHIKEPSSTAILVPGTPKFDKKSIMRTYTNDIVGLSGLTENDKKATKRLYSNQANKICK